ncbi:hypothetical protein ALC56_01606 [Trachymyrmex septentrionalis]|uniref:DUF4802 domain-containing protein n=1 Tax=Trachymyrmex septentrionalis TaxID=34720 RepID=A0A195FUV0_9HYME|nr:hypothetical protein ALC56_01606 [Trachymyrmex septentrionalis]
MLKSRSSGDSRSNSVESEEQQRQINQSLPSGTDEFADAPETETDKNCLSVRNEQTIPSSPPPSYEHVLEESTFTIASIENCLRDPSSVSRIMRVAIRSNNSTWGISRGIQNMRHPKRGLDIHDSSLMENVTRGINIHRIVTNSRVTRTAIASSDHLSQATRMESSAIALREAKEGNMEKQVPSNEKSTEDSEDGGDDGSGGPRGGDRKAAKKILHKSSKEFYKAMAKQWGITCKMSDHCRCLDCQSHYFDCDYEKDEQAKGDGGLSAGTPMFISEVMHGTACALL